MERRENVWLSAAADLILPRRCLVCNRKLNLAERHLCLGCLADMPKTRFWTIMYNPMADRFNEAIQKSLDATDNPSSEREKYAYAVSLFFYDNQKEYKQIPYNIKYHGNIAAGRYFGKMLGEYLAQCPWMQDVDAVIPVPLHRIRKWKRGYNQAEVIANEVAATLKIPLRTDLLKRIRSTKTQTRLDVRKKSENVKGAFKAALHDSDRFRHIIIVDDIFTTGSTLMACFTALREIFPPSVRISVATLAFVGGT